MDKETINVIHSLGLEGFAKNASLIPQIVENEHQRVVEVTICDSMSGGADLLNDMPRYVTLSRMNDRYQHFTARYRQVTIEDELREYGRLDKFEVTDNSVEVLITEGFSDNYKSAMQVGDLLVKHFPQFPIVNKAVTDVGICHYIFTKPKNK